MRLDPQDFPALLEKGRLERQIDAIEREIGLRKASFGLWASPGWEAFTKFLAKDRDRALSAIRDVDPVDTARVAKIQERLLILDSLLESPSNGQGKVDNLAVRLDKLKARLTVIRQMPAVQFAEDQTGV